MTVLPTIIAFLLLGFGLSRIQYKPSRKPVWPSERWSGLVHGDAVRTQLSLLLLLLGLLVGLVTVLLLGYGQLGAYAMIAGISAALGHEWGSHIPYERHRGSKRSGKFPWAVIVPAALFPAALLAYFRYVHGPAEHSFLYWVAYFYMFALGVCIYVWLVVIFIPNLLNRIKTR